MARADVPGSRAGPAGLAGPSRRYRDPARAPRSERALERGGQVGEGRVLRRRQGGLRRSRAQCPRRRRAVRVPAAVRERAALRPALRGGAGIDAGCREPGLGGGHPPQSRGYCPGGGRAGASRVALRGVPGAAAGAGGSVGLPVRSLDARVDRTSVREPCGVRANRRRPEGVDGSIRLDSPLRRTERHEVRASGRRRRRGLGRCGGNHAGQRTVLCLAPARGAAHPQRQPVLHPGRLPIRPRFPPPAAWLG